MLVDSQVVIGAATKGGSPFVPLNSLLRRLAALTFAGGLVLRLVFTPSEHNPSDYPSRGDSSSWPAGLQNASRHGISGGLRFARRVKHLAIKRKPDRDRLLQYVTQLDITWRRLRETGMVDSASVSTMTTSSC